MPERTGAPAAGAIRVAVVAEQRIVAEALAAALALRPDLEVVEPAGPRRGAAAAAAKPEVVLVSVTGHRTRALDRLVQVRRRLPECGLVAVGVESEREVLDFVEAGAVGYVLATAAPAALAVAVRAAHEGKARCSPVVLAALRARLRELAAASAAAAPRVPVPPTRRQVEVLKLLAEGLGNKQIAQRLGISRQTAKNHVHRLLELLGVHRRREAVRIAYQAQILDGPAPRVVLERNARS